jgi:pentatricopeptide repeat protein
MGVFARPALGRVTKVLERLVSAVGETTGVSSTRHARGRPRGDFARVSSSADARDALRDADTRRSLRRPPRSDPRLDPARGRRRRGRDVPHGTARGFAALAASPPRREGSDRDLPTGVRATAGVDAATASESGSSESDGVASGPDELSARSRDDPHDDESGKTPRASFHKRMRDALDRKRPEEALTVFGELSSLYPDDQGAPAYDMLMRLAALAGDPDAALDAFEASLALRYEPSSFQHGQIILAHARAGEPRRGAEWLAMLIDTNGSEWARTSKSAAKLFERVLTGAAHAGDAMLFRESFVKMKNAGATPGEAALEAFLLLLSKIGAPSESIETVWRDTHTFGDLKMNHRSSRLLLRRVEAHARAARTFERAARDGGFCFYLYHGEDRLYVSSRTDDSNDADDTSVNEDSPGSGSLESLLNDPRTYDARFSKNNALASARASRRAGEDALNELVARNSEPTDFSTRVRHPRDVRDAVTAMAGAFAAAGDSDAVRALMERAGAVGVEPDQHVFNALLRSEAAAAAARLEDDDDDDDDDAFASDEDRHDAFAFFRDDDDESEASLRSSHVPRSPVLAQFDARAKAAHEAVLRVETMMRDMIESGVEPDLHSFMALLSAYARAGDVAAAGDALQGMRERRIPVDTLAFNALLQACATSGDLDAAVRIRDEMRKASETVEPDAVTFLHLFRACARRSRQVAAVLRDKDDWDDWDDVWGVGVGGASSEKQKSHARLAGALVEKSDGGSVAGVAAVGDAARAAARAAREGLSSVTDVLQRGVGGLASSEAEGVLRGSAFGGKNASPELARARAALVSFRDDMARCGVSYTRKCATAAMAALGSLREFDAMMSFLRDPPNGVVPDAYMYTQALHSLAQDPFHWRRRAARDFKDRETHTTGPAAALALADEMAVRGIRGTRVTLNCVLLACARMKNYGEARRRFDAHVAAGGEVGADTFNCLFKAAFVCGVFESESRAIADEMEAAMETDVACEPNAHTELTLRRVGGISISGRDAYTPDGAAANDLLVRFGFDSAPAPETPWAPIDERFETRVVHDDEKRRHGEAFADDDAVRGEDRDVGSAGARREGRRWNR